jgi:hypothetical protein
MHCVGVSVGGGLPASGMSNIFNSTSLRILNARSAPVLLKDVCDVGSYPTPHGAGDTVEFHASSGQAAKCFISMS